uniref:Uncharacterized protein n=1 Tax=Arundo donax TaxID=35708 RepID=A0A0A8YHI7_ARUDO
MLKRNQVGHVVTVSGSNSRHSELPSRNGIVRLLHSSQNCCVVSKAPCKLKTAVGRILRRNSTFAIFW